MDITQLLKIMNDRGASDLFVTAGARPSIKVDGTLKPLTKEALKPDQARKLTCSTMNDQQLVEFESTRECNFAISAQGLGRYRVSAFYQRNSPGMVLRRINTRIPTMEELHLPAVLKDLAMAKRGLILFVGGTSTGKSTSLASMIDYRNSNSGGHIITIEDPIEYIHDHKQSLITQREVGLDTDSFEVALKNTLRQAPDVILMGKSVALTPWATACRSLKPVTCVWRPCTPIMLTRRWTGSSVSSRRRVMRRSGWICL